MDKIYYTGVAEAQNLKTKVGFPDVSSIRLSSFNTIPVLKFFVGWHHLQERSPRRFRQRRQVDDRVGARRYVGRSRRFMQLRQHAQDVPDQDGWR